MDGVYLKEVQGDYLFAKSVCDRLPSDSAVLFHAAGRFSPGYLPILAYIAADESYAQISSPSERSDMQNFSPNSGFKKLREIIRGDNDKLDQFHDKTSELFDNASTHGVDAFAVPAVRSRGQEDEDYEQDVMKMNRGLRAMSHSSAAILHAGSTHQLWIMTQNYISQHAAEDLTARYRQVNEVPAQLRQLQAKLLPPIRAADKRDQPLLQKGGPIGSVIHPQDWLSRTYRHHSLRMGMERIFDSISEPSEYAFRAAEITKLPPQGKTRQALEESAQRLKIQPQNLISFTLAVPLPLG